MSPRQLIVLAIAAIAAIGALLLIRGIAGGRPEPEQAAAEAIPGEQVLVATRNIAQGAALTPGDLGVARFPTGSVAPSFVRLSTQPSAQADYTGAVTRRAFAQGEPITTESVIQPDGRGFLAAQLDPGYRAVAVEISPASAAGGYIQPNDRVDVIVTQKLEGGDTDTVRSDIILTDVRVLALGDKTETQTEGEEPETVDANVAVLELTAEDARSLALAVELGEVSLALRGVQAETVSLQSSAGSGARLSQQSGGVIVHAFGSITGGGQ